MRDIIERFVAICVLGLMVASFFTGFTVIVRLGYEYVIGQAAAFCR